MKFDHKDIINCLIINGLILLLIIFNIIGSDISFRLVLGLTFKEIYAYGYDICFALIIVSILWLINSYCIKKYLLIIFSFLYQALSFYLLMKIQNDIFLILLVNDIGNFIFQIGLFIFIFVITVVCLVLVDKRFKQIKLPIIFSLMAIVSLVGGIFGYNTIKKYVQLDYELTKQNRHPGYVEKYRHSLDDYEVIEKLGLFRYEETLIENYQFSLNAHKISDEAINEAEKFLNSYLNNDNDNEYTGIFANKNLIMILCESLDDSIVNEELMPNLYKMMNNSWYFADYYAPLLKYHTSDSEFISQTGMLPSQRYGSTYMNFANNSYPYSLGNLFKDIGYNTNAYHSFYEYFYNRDVMYDSLGIDNFYGARELELKVDKNDLNGLNGFYEDEKLLEKMFDTTNINEPFYNLVLSLSGHSSYRSTRPDIQEKLAILNNMDEYKDYPQEAKCYIASQMLLDDAIGYLVNRLDELGILDDTVICLFSDHYPYGMADKKSLDLIVDNSTPYSASQVFSLIYNSEMEPKVIEDTTSTFDLYPTLANLFGLDISKAYTIGHDIFSDSSRFVLFGNGDVLNDEYYYSASSDLIYKRNMEVAGSYDDEFNQALNDVENILNHAQDVLRADLYNQ